MQAFVFDQMAQLLIEERMTEQKQQLKYFINFSGSDVEFLRFIFDTVELSSFY